MWIGCDLDSTLAIWPIPEGVEGIGEPIPMMAARIRRHLANGEEVRIVTARVGENNLPDGESQEFIASQRTMIQDWTEKHFGVRLKVTASKDFEMYFLYDDRCVTVEANTGTILTKGKEWL